jgi:hypothetical protein
VAQGVERVERKNRLLRLLAEALAEALIPFLCAFGNIEI